MVFIKSTEDNQIQRGRNMNYYGGLFFQTGNKGFYCLFSCPDPDMFDKQSVIQEYFGGNGQIHYLQKLTREEFLVKLGLYSPKHISIGG